MFNMPDLVYSLPDPGDWVFRMLGKRNPQSRKEEVKSLRLTALEGGRVGAWGDDKAAAEIAMSQLY